MLRGDAAKVRRRLISIGRKLESQLKRQGVPQPSGLSQTVDEQISQAIATSQSEGGFTQSEGEFTQSGTSSSQNAGGSNGANSLGGNASSSATGTTAGSIQGGNAPGPLPDTGWELVELIQRVVAPDFWDSRGGPGTIRYFAMRRVLVVRATSDVHEQIRDLLMALR
jgi:hypothetical protein